MTRISVASVIAAIFAVQALTVPARADDTTEQKILQRLDALEKQNAALAKGLTTPDPPMESIGQSMNFVVTVGLSTTPNWTYLHWKAPANGSSLAALSGIRTHTLNVALGAPSAAGVTEVQRVLNNAATRQAIQGLMQ